MFGYDRPPPTPEEQERIRLASERYDRERRYGALMDVIKQLGSAEDHAEACEAMTEAIRPIVQRLLATKQ